MLFKTSCDWESDTTGYFNPKYYNAVTVYGIPFNLLAILSASDSIILYNIEDYLTYNSQISSNRKCIKASTSRSNLLNISLLSSNARSESV